QSAVDSSPETLADFGRPGYATIGEQDSDFTAQYSTMKLTLKALGAVAFATVLVAVVITAYRPRAGKNKIAEIDKAESGQVTVDTDVAHDVSKPLNSLSAPDEKDEEDEAEREEAGRQNPPAPIKPPVITSPPGAAKVEQQSQGAKPGATLV